MDAPICSKCCKSLESSKRYADTPRQSARKMTERNNADTTHAALPKGLQSSIAAPPSLQKVTSTHPTLATPAIGLQVPEYVNCHAISTSHANFFLALAICRTRSEEIDMLGVLFGRNFHMLAVS
jgi:hypothetical protein